MATVTDLSEPYGAFMRNPLRPDAENVCEVCLRFTDGRFSICYQCGHQLRYADAVLPVSYTGYDGQLYHALKHYKSPYDQTTARRRLQRQLAAVLWRFLAAHEACLGAAVAVGGRFDVVTTVPSSDAGRDDSHPLRSMVGETIELTRNRFSRLLARSDVDAEKRSVVPEKFVPIEPVEGASVLLVDDTWVTGGSLQSAAGALRAAGASAVGAVVLGRLIDQEYGDQGERLDALPKQFDWDSCALHAGA